MLRMLAHVRATDVFIVGAAGSRAAPGRCECVASSVNLIRRVAILRTIEFRGDAINSPARHRKRSPKPGFSAMLPAERFCPKCRLLQKRATKSIRFFVVRRIHFNMLWTVWRTASGRPKASKTVNSKGYHYAEMIGEGCIGCSNCAVVCPDSVITVYRVKI